MPVLKASFIFVPTPSVLETSTGFLYLGNSYKPPKLPTELSTFFVYVVWTCFFSLSTASFAWSMSTPASLYSMYHPVRFKDFLFELISVCFEFVMMAKDCNCGQCCV